MSNTYLVCIRRKCMYILPSKITQVHKSSVKNNVGNQ